MGLPGRRRKDIWLFAAILNQCKIRLALGRLCYSCTESDHFLRISSK